MDAPTREASRAETSQERTLKVLEALGAALSRNGTNDSLDNRIEPHPVPVQDRIRRLPEAVLLTAGYYASLAPAIGDLARRIRTLR